MSDDFIYTPTYRVGTLPLGQGFIVPVTQKPEDFLDIINQEYFYILYWSFGSKCYCQARRTVDMSLNDAARLQANGMRLEGFYNWYGQGFCSPSDLRAAAAERNLKINQAAQVKLNLAAEDHPAWGLL